MGETARIFDFVAHADVASDTILANFHAMAIPPMWAEGNGENAVVAVLDTGIDFKHADLQKAVIDGMNFTGGIHSDYMDRHGHGTHVAGIIGARENGFAGIGVSPKCSLVACKVLGDNGSGDTDGIVEAIDWCIAWKKDGKRIHVINMSLGSSRYEKSFHDAVKRAVSAGIAVVCAMGNGGDGNSGTDEISYPAYFPEVIAVGATDNFRKITNFSNTNKEVDVCAPGSYIYSTIPGGWTSLSGTSMACPHVAGFIANQIDAIYKKTGEFPSENSIWHMVRAFARKKPEMKIDPAYGAGFLSYLPDNVAEVEEVSMTFYKDRKDYLVNGVKHEFDFPLKLETVPAMRYVGSGRLFLQHSLTQSVINPIDNGFVAKGMRIKPIK